MKSSLKIKLPGRTPGNLALTCSLFLHVGFVALFSYWQWDERAPEKIPPKVIRVKFLPAELFTLPVESRAKLAALPRKLVQSPSADRNAPEADLNGLRGLFTGKVRQQVANAKYYPRIARRRGMEGRPVIAFTLDKGGRLMEVDLARTSGYQLLDQAALEAVNQGAPYPEIPAELKTDTFQFKLPISFVLK